MTSKPAFDPAALLVAFVLIGASGAVTGALLMALGC